MDTVEFCALTKESVAKLINNRQAQTDRRARKCRRQTPRWPFPGTVELWIPEEGGSERHVLASSINLSANGVGITVDELLALDLEMAIAIHEPEISFHGRCIVRHCTAIDEGYYVGLAFAFDKRMP